jgi:hypothetical protein
MDRAHQLKPNSVEQFTQAVEKDMIPLLRKRQGYKDELAFVPSDGKEAVAISLRGKRSAS